MASAFVRVRSASARPILPSGYGKWLKSLKSRIASARQRAALLINQELVTLYHSIGKDILQRQASEGWGAKVIQRLTSDLSEAFPDMKEFSTRNLHYMRLFAEDCPEMRIVQQPADQLPWFYIVSLLRKVSESGISATGPSPQNPSNLRENLVSSRHDSEAVL